MKYARNLSLASETSSLRSIGYAKGLTIASAHHERSRGATNHNVGRSLPERTGLGNPRKVKKTPRVEKKRVVDLTRRLEARDRRLEGW